MNQIMIILKKGNHYEHTTDGSKASEMMQEGYEVVKGSSLLAKVESIGKVKPGDSIEIL